MSYTKLNDYKRKPRSRFEIQSCPFVIQENEKQEHQARYVAQHSSARPCALQLAKIIRREYEFGIRPPTESEDAATAVASTEKIRELEEANGCNPNRIEECQAFAEKSKKR
jgi:hypothetical protein